MRPIRLTKAEAAAIREAISDRQDWEAKVFQSVLDKLDAAEAQAPAGVAVGPVEQALERTARGKVVRLAGGQGGGAAYGRASKQATALGVTVEDAEVVGAWLARQGWLREPVTILTVLNKWPEWLARARATAAPPAAKEGFDAGSTATGTDGEGHGGGGRGRREGFRP